MKRWTIGLIAVLALVAAACGAGDDAGSGIASADDITAAAADSDGVASLGDEESEDGETGGEATQTDEEQLLAFSQCLRDEGLDVDDPTVDSDGNVDLRSIFRNAGDGGPPEGFREAFDACSVHVEDLELGRGAGVDQTELQDNLLEFAACMRDNGYDMADPDLSRLGEPGAGGGGGVFGDIDPDDPAFQTAQEACDDILAGFGPGGGGGRGNQGEG